MWDMGHRTWNERDGVLGFRFRFLCEEYGYALWISLCLGSDLIVISCTDIYTIQS